MLLKNKSLVAVMSCALMLAAAPLLPADLSIINAAVAKEGGGGGGGNGGGHGGGNGGGNGGGHGAGEGGGRAGADHAGNTSSNGHGKGLASDHAGKATRNHGTSGNHFGSERNNDNGHGVATSGVAHSRDTRGIDKARAISDTTPGDHNSKGLSKTGSHKTH
ncbi:hypothetical protein [Pseudomonas sp. KCJK9016]|uniref:hypothetical protein n=1 Tax=Pseudomonas sp. KCJK9016 TaxID=3344556 RepID=UPI0039064780